MFLKWLAKMSEETAHFTNGEWRKWLTQYRKEIQPWERMELTKDLVAHGRKITVHQLKEAMLVNESWLGKKVALGELWPLVSDKHNFFELLELCQSNEQRIDIRIVCRH